MKKDMTHLTWVRATGESMVPLIKSGTSVQVDFRNTASSPRIGEIVVFLIHHRLVIHRVVAIWGTGKKKKFLLKGDNSRKSDGWIEKRAILGKVKKIKHARQEIILTNTRSYLFNYVFLAYSLSTGIFNIHGGVLKSLFRPLYQGIMFLYSKTSIT
jgi:signal peptidase I